MILAVRPRILLPHHVLINGKDTAFQPTADVPADWAAGVTSKPGSAYFIPSDKDPVVLSSYKWSVPGMNAMLEECTRKATTEQYQKILDFARETVFGKPVTTAATPTPEAPETPQEPEAPTGGVAPSVPLVPKEEPSTPETPNTGSDLKASDAPVGTPEVLDTTPAPEVEPPAQEEEPATEPSIELDTTPETPTSEDEPKQ